MDDVDRVPYSVSHKVVEMDVTNGVSERYLFMEKLPNNGRNQ